MQKFEIGTFPLQSERLTTKLQRPVYQVGNNQVKCIDPNPCYVRIKQNICMYIYECSTYQLNISVSQSFSQHVLVFSVNKKLRLKKKKASYCFSHMYVTSLWLHSTSTHFRSSPTHSIIIQLNVALLVGRPSAQFVQVEPIGKPVSIHRHEPSTAKSEPPIQYRQYRLPMIRNSLLLSIVEVSSISD